MISLEQKKAVIRRFHEEGTNKGIVFYDLLAPSYVGHLASGQQMSGPEPFKQYESVMRTAFPDMHVTIGEIIGEGDIFACRINFTGTHTGAFMGIPPTNKRFDVTEAVFVRFEGDKIAEEWQYLNQLAMFQQLGVSPPTKQ